MDKLLLLVLGAAVQSSQRLEIIASLKNMPVETQHAFMEKITQVTRVKNILYFYSSNLFELEEKSAGIIVKKVSWCSYYNDS